MSIHKELSFVLPNKAGTLGKITSALAAKGVSLLAIDASAGLEHNIVRLVPDNVTKALAVLNKHKLNPGASNVLCVTLSDRKGSIAKVARALGKAGINIEYLFATAGHGGSKAMVVLRTADNRKAQQALKKTC
jgi:hypothetical protein